MSMSSIKACANSHFIVYPFFGQFFNLQIPKNLEQGKVSHFDSAIKSCKIPKYHAHVWQIHQWFALKVRDW